MGILIDPGHEAGVFDCRSNHCHCHWCCQQTCFSLFIQHPLNISRPTSQASCEVCPEKGENKSVYKHNELICLHRRLLLLEFSSVNVRVTHPESGAILFEILTPPAFHTGRYSMCKNVAAADNQYHANKTSRLITGTFVIYSDLYEVSNVIFRR